MWRRGTKPQNIPSDFYEHHPASATWLVRTWLTNGHLDRYRQCDLYREFHHSSVNLSRVNQGQMEAWLSDQLATGQLRIGGLRDPVESFNQDKFQEARAKLLGGDVPKHVRPVPLAEQTTTYTVYEGSGGTAIADENDAASENPTCPNPYHRSETLESTSPEVRDWLDTNETRGEVPQRKLLGGFAGAGGGFLEGTTEVVTVPAGTTLWRYVDEPEKPWGGWWFFHAYEGDPRVFAALPPLSSGNVLVQGKTKVAFQALCGPGAPRCTNKPGGPPQLCIPYAPPSDVNENTYIRLV